MRKTVLIFILLVMVCLTACLAAGCNWGPKEQLPFERGDGEEDFLPFEVNQKNIRLAVEKQYDAKKNITFYASKIDSLSFKSEDTGIVSVNKQGIITAINEGSTEIIVDYDDNQFKKSERLNVRVVDVDIRIEKLYLPIIDIGDSVVSEVTFNDNDLGFGPNDIEFSVKTGDDFLEYRDDKFYAVGCGEGVIKASMKKDPTIFIEQAFQTKFADTNVGQAIRARLNYLTGLNTFIGYITKDQLEMVDELNLEAMHITKINDIKALKNIRKINLNNTYDSRYLTDYSFIGFLSHLEDISLSDNRIPDVSFLAGNVSLVNLNLSTNSITAISALPNVINIQSLNLSDNGISDFSFLNNASQMRILDISNNRTTNADFLDKMFNLERLDVAENPITSLSKLESKTELIYLSAHGAPVSSIGNLSTKLKHIDIYGSKVANLNFLSSCKQIQYIDFGANGNITTIAPLENITTIIRFLAPDNRITSLEPIKNCGNLKVLDVANNSLNVNTPDLLKDFLKLEELYIGGNILITSLSFLNTDAARNNLKRLNIGELKVSVSDIQNYVSQLSKLEWLQLYKLNLTSCEFLAHTNLPNLRYLKLYDNNIINFAPVLHVSVLVIDYSDYRQY